MIAQSRSLGKWGRLCGFPCGGMLVRDSIVGSDNVARPETTNPVSKCNIGDLQNCLLFIGGRCDGLLQSDAWRDRVTSHCRFFCFGGACGANALEEVQTKRVMSPDAAAHNYGKIPLQMRSLNLQNTH